MSLRRPPTRIELKSDDIDEYEEVRPAMMACRQQAEMTGHGRYERCVPSSPSLDVRCSRDLTILYFISAQERKAHERSGRLVGCQGDRQRRGRAHATRTKVIGRTYRYSPSLERIVTHVHDPRQAVRCLGEAAGSFESQHAAEPTGAE